VIERELTLWYIDVSGRALELLTPAKVEIAVQLVRTPDLIRGYDEIKLGNVELARRQADLLLNRMEAGGRILPVVARRPV
jgi:indolepyruvate ferredoxin oxidoreductase